MKKILFLIFTINLAACTELQNLAGAVLTEGQGLTTTQIGQGLKEALTIGIGNGAARLGSTDGYYKSAYKILLPEEARQVTSKLQNVPLFGNVEEKILEKINHAAEDAATKAKPIFVSAIREMTFQDATSILMGEKNAATQYLNKATRAKLYAEFQPVIVNSLNKFGAIDYWADAVNTYNKIPFVKKMNPKLDDWVAQQALNGLFSMVEKKELDIRKNVTSRTSDLLRKVFAKQDNG
ncbi:MAG: DUF4197 domain-containing protein [Saprospiraceae bacterium]|nr:DUF4197 domain-containing protein [Saprospiraceae bacterium]